MYTTLSDNLDAKQAKSVERALLQIEHASTLTVRYWTYAPFLTFTEYVTHILALLLLQVNDNEAATQLHSQFRFPDRSSEDVPLRSMRSSIEPLRWIHKPLSLYFLLQGLLRHSDSDLRYYWNIVLTEAEQTELREICGSCLLCT